MFTDMVHRDLKLENILLSTADQSDSFNIKVSPHTSAILHHGSTMIYRIMGCTVCNINVLIGGKECNHSRLLSLLKSYKYDKQSRKL